jgi:hydroxyacylglutathione hydrolase
MILEVFPSGPLETNAYLLICEVTKHAAIIDVPPKSSDTLLQRIKELSLSMDMILLTHSHWDHIAEVSLLKKHLNVPVYIHKEDADNLEHPGSDQLPLFFPLKGIKPDGYLADGQKLVLGKLVIIVIHTPGHSPGSICFYLPSENILISGDTLFKGTIGKLNLPTARPVLMWDSLKKLAALPNATKVYPGHGDSTTIGAERWIAHAQDRFS